MSLSVMHAGGHSTVCEFCGTVFLWVRLALSAFTPAAASSLFFDLALCASWSAGTPRLRHVRKDRPVYMSGGAFSLSFSLVLFARLAPFRRLPFTTVHHESLSAPSSLSRGALHLALHLWTDVWSFCTSALSVLPLRVRTECGAPSLHSDAAVDVHFETLLCLLGLLILLHLLDHRNVSLDAPENLDNLINDLQLKNLHDFVQSGCSTHLRLHFRIVRILTRHRLCSLCTTGTSTFLSVNFHSFPCLLRRWHLHEISGISST